MLANERISSSRQKLSRNENGEKLEIKKVKSLERGVWRELVEKDQVIEVNEEIKQEMSYYIVFNDGITILNREWELLQSKNLRRGWGKWYFF